MVHHYAPPGLAVRRRWLVYPVVGLVLGGGIVLWKAQHMPPPQISFDKGGSVVLNTAPTPEITPEPGALLVRPNSGSGGGNVQGMSLEGAQPTTAPSAREVSSQEPLLPTKEEFAKYESMKGEQSAYYSDLRIGKGPEVKVGSLAAVIYRGWLTDGTIFDDTFDKRTAFEFKEGDHRVIAGWEQTIIGMKQGGKRRLIIPPALGYGAAGNGPVPPNAMLIFDVELVSVK